MLSNSSGTNFRSIYTAHHFWIIRQPFSPSKTSSILSKGCFFPIYSISAACYFPDHHFSSFPRILFEVLKSSPLCQFIHQPIFLYPLSVITHGNISLSSLQSGLILRGQVPVVFLIFFSEVVCHYILPRAVRKELAYPAGFVLKTGLEVTVFQFLD